MIWASLTGIYSCLQIQTEKYYSYNCSSICAANKYFARTFLCPNKIALAAKYAALSTSPWQRN